MKEEFHGDASVSPGKYKLLYGWNSLTVNVWLPSLSELVGIDPNKYNATSGVYLSAMQGLNTSNNYYTDAQGGSQFAYFKQYNAQGGGEVIMNACKQEVSWLRSPHYGRANGVWATLNQTAMDASADSIATLSRAVHPAVFLLSQSYPIHTPCPLCYLSVSVALLLQWDSVIIKKTKNLEHLQPGE